MMSNGRDNHIKTLGFLMERFRKNNFTQQMEVLYLIRRYWKSALGEQLAAHAWPAKLGQREFLVYVDDSSWLSQYHLYKDDIREKIQKTLERREKLYYKIPKFRFMLRDSIPHFEDVVPPHEIILKLSEETRKIIDQKLAGVKDPELKQALRRYFITSSLVEEKRVTED